MIQEIKESNWAKKTQYLQKVDAMFLYDYVHKNQKILPDVQVNLDLAFEEIKEMEKEFKGWSILYGEDYPLPE